MATISDMIKIQLGLETAEFNKSLQKSKENIQKTSSELAKGADQVAGKAIGQIAGIARMVAAPLAGAMSIGSMIKSYFGGVAQVAQMTGAYSPKLDEWRKKRALLNRVTAEDIQLYKKSREALTKFQITLADISAKVMRQASPAFKYFVEKLEKVSEWMDAHSDDIVRFITVLAGVIATALTPALLKMAAALLLNPITWIVAALVGLALVIDDLIVWLQGGESALDAFWSQFGSREQVLAKIQTAIKLTVATLEAMWESLRAGVKAAVDWFGEFWSSCNGTERVINTLKDVFHSVVQTVKDVIAIWDALVDSMKKTGFLDDLANAFDGALSFILGAFKLFFSALQAIFGLIKGLLTGDWGSFKEAVSKAVESAEEAFSGLLKIIGSVLNQLWELSKEIFGRIGSSLTGVIFSAVEGVKNTLLSLFESVKAIVNQVEEQIKEALTFSAVEGAKNTLLSLFESVRAIVNQVAEQIKETLTSIGDSIKSSISDVVDGIKSAFTGLLDTGKDVLNQLWELSKEIFGRIGSSITGVIFSAVEGAKNTLLSLFESVKAIVNQVEEQIKETLTRIGDSIKSSISDAIDGIKSAFTGLLDTVKSVLTQIWEMAKEIFAHIGTALKEALTPDLDKWSKKLNPMNWFSDDDDEKKENDTGTDSRAEPVAQMQPKTPVEAETETRTPPSDVFSDLSQMQNSGQVAERNVVNNSSNSNRTSVDSHATVNITTNNPAVADAVVEQVAPVGDSSAYVDQSVVAIS